MRLQNDLAFIRRNYEPSETTGFLPEFLYESVACDLCGSEESSPKYRVTTASLHLSHVWMDGVKWQLAETETIVVCLNCGLVYATPRLAPIANVTAWLGRMPVSFLDVGCGDGVLVEIARELGIQSFGPEISAALVDLARRLGKDAIKTEALSEFVSGSCDVVTVIDVMEHARSSG